MLFDALSICSREEAASHNNPRSVHSIVFSASVQHTLGEDAAFGGAPGGPILLYLSYVQHTFVKMLSARGAPGVFIFLQCSYV